MFAKNHKFKIICFVLIVNVMIFSGLEWIAGYLIQENNIYKQVGMMDGNHPLMEFDGDLGYQIRKQGMRKEIYTFPLVVEKHKVTDVSGKPIPSKLSFTDNEGIIRGEHGDLIINNLGFRGPHFEKNKTPDTFRIVAMGGSTTAGMYENELTYPRLLERMLNRVASGKQKIEVINAGVWGHTSCQVEKRYKKEIIDLKPDLILLMSGWNDINKIRALDIKNRNQYCMNHHPILVHSNIFRFLRLKIGERVKKSVAELGVEVLQSNANYYVENLRELIENAGAQDTQVVLVSLPALFEIENLNKFSEYEQFSDFSLQEIKYRQNVVIHMNSLKKKLAKEYKHVFYVDNGVSPLTVGKSKFFADTIHPTGAGNRVLAFQLFKYLNERYKFGESFGENYREGNWSKIKLELEYIKSIFASNQTEDLSFSACLALHGGVCTYKDDPIPAHVHMTGINEFVLGSMLQYPLVVKDPDIRKLFERLMKNAITIDPGFSVSYWIFGTFYSVVGEKELASKYLDEAFKINPPLRNFSFAKNKNRFLKKFQKDPFVIDYVRFVNLINREHVPGGYFMKYNFHLSAEYLNEKSPEEAIAHHVEFYYLAPLLARSIFSNAVSYLKNRQNHELAERIIKKTRQLTVQNGLSPLS